MIKKRVFGLCVAIAMLISCECFADCSGARRTPLRNLVAARPIRTATQNVFQKIAVSSRSQSCAGSMQSSCTGSAHSVIVGSAPVAPSDSNYAIAKQKSDQQAASGRMRHVGGSMGSAKYEGVGFSTVSPERAQHIACYYGQRPLVASAVSRGANGWYATNLYN